jgi:hypothetical protein
LIIGEADRDSTVFYQYAVGGLSGDRLFVYFRRKYSAACAALLHSVRASFVLFTFHYSGKLNNF